MTNLYHNPYADNACVKVKQRIKEAIQLCLEVQGKEYTPLHLVGVQKVMI
jgi:predicted RNase H-like HicB family nuclease